MPGTNRNANKAPPDPAAVSLPRIPGSVPCLIAAVVDALTFVAIVSVDVAASAPGVTLAGLKLQVALAGKPEQLRVVAELNPFDGVTVTVAVVVPPAVIVADVGLVPIEKLGGGVEMVMVCAAETAAA